MQMISGIFLLQLLLTFITGSTWIFLTVYAGTHFGSKTGGFIGGLPSTALLAFFFIGYTQSPSVASQATTVFPLGMGISGLFLVVFAWVSRYGFLKGVLAGLVSWFILSLPIAFFPPERFAINLLVYTTILIFAFYILEKRLKIKTLPARKSDHTLLHMFFRSLFGGIIITLAVLIAKIGGPHLGGIFAAFPAMFLSTLAVTYRDHGINFSRAITKPLLVTGMITVAVYAISVRYLYLSTGLYPGTLLSILIASVSAYLTYRFVLPGLT
jgi:hypothetical protein